MKSLYSRMTDWLYSQKDKHALPDDFVESHINEMTQHQFLDEISHEIDQMFHDFKRELEENRG